MAILIYVFLVILFIALPLPLQFIFFIINAFYPDPIPAIDEVIMFVSMCKKINTATMIMEFFGEHKILAKILIVLVIGAVILGLIWLFR